MLANCWTGCAVRLSLASNFLLCVLCVCVYQDCVMMNAPFILISLLVWTADWSPSPSIAAPSPLLVLLYPQICPHCIIRHLFSLCHSFTLFLTISASVSLNLQLFIPFFSLWFPALVPRPHTFYPSFLSLFIPSCLGDTLSFSHFLSV